MSDQKSNQELIPATDWVFENLVRSVNTEDHFFMSVTLCVNGGVLTGELISPRLYFYEYGKLWEQVLAKAGDFAQKIRGNWEAIGEKELAELRGSDRKTVTFFHLRNARIVVGPQPIPNVGGFLWRGRISEVSGFAIGSLNVASTE